MEKIELNRSVSFVLKSAEVDTLAKLIRTALMKMYKNPLADSFELLFKLLRSNTGLCKSAAGKVDMLQVNSS